MAFVNPDEVKVTVLTNGGSERTVSLQMAGRAAVIALPKDSITTLSWR